MISFRSGGCLNKLERVKANIIKMLSLNEKIHITTMYTYGHSNVRFYALLFVSSCRPKRNYPAAETERIFENRYNKSSRNNWEALHVKG